MPIEGPVAGVRIARTIAEDGLVDYIVNPTFEEAEASDLNLTVAGTKEYISMVECGADEVTEEDMIGALEFAQEAIGAFCEEQQKFLDKCTIEPKTYELDEPIPEVVSKVDGFYAAMEAALKDADKQSRIAKVEELKDEIKAVPFTDEERSMWGREIAAACKALEKRAMRTMIIETGERVDGRANDEIRPLDIVPHYLPRAHGSGLFQRGQTQVLSVVTLGMLNEWQRLDTIDPAEGKRYIHQYNFPPYCTGEVGRMGAPKRRELGHGALGVPRARADDSQRGGVPVHHSRRLRGHGVQRFVVHGVDLRFHARAHGERWRAHQAPGFRCGHGPHQGRRPARHPDRYPGSRGLPRRHGLQGLRHDRGHHGPADGQQGQGPLDRDSLAEALGQAKRGRAFILDAMLEKIPAPREELSEYAPRIITIKIPVDKIRDIVIGTGGKVIRGIQEETGASIEVHEDGNVFIASVDTGGEVARKMVEDIVKVPEVGEEYEGEVVNIQSFGAFVKLTPNKDGLLHISRVANGRVGAVEDVLSEGDIVKVKIIEVDEKTGKISLDRLDKPDAPEGSSKPRNDKGHGNDRNNRRSKDTRKPRRRD